MESHDELANGAIKVCSGCISGTGTRFFGATVDHAQVDHA
mgnify:FL=1